MAKKLDPNAHKSERPDERQISPAVGVENNKEQLSRREAIADGADATRTGDLTPIDDDVQVVVKPPEAEEITETQPVTETTEVIEEPEKFDVPVNGKMVKMTKDELIATAAKVSSADEYLRASSESVKTAARLALSTDEPNKEETDFRALAKALQIGTEDEAEQALRQLVKLQPSKTPDVVGLVDERLTTREAVRLAEEEQKEIVNHPVLREVFEQRLSLYIKDHPTETIKHGYKNVGDSIRKDFEVMLKTPGSKAERKAQVAAVPTAAGRQQTVSDDEGEESVEATIAGIAKARGQARPISH